MMSSFWIAGLSSKRSKQIRKHCPTNTKALRWRMHVHGLTFGAPPNGCFTVLDVVLVSSNGQTGKKPQFDDTALLGIDPGQVIESIVESDDVESRLGHALFDTVDGQLNDGAAALTGVAASRVFDDDLPHEMRRNAKEVDAVFPLRHGIAGEADKRLMHKGRAAGCDRAVRGEDNDARAAAFRHRPAA